MKKLLSMFMAIAIFFSIITVPVTAAPTKGSITITNATKGKTYEVYKWTRKNWKYILWKK